MGPNQSIESNSIALHRRLHRATRSRYMIQLNRTTRDRIKRHQTRQHAVASERVTSDSVRTNHITPKSSSAATTAHRTTSLPKCRRPTNRASIRTVRLRSSPRVAAETAAAVMPRIEPHYIAENRTGLRDDHIHKHRANTARPHRIKIDRYHAAASAFTPNSAALPHHQPSTPSFDSLPLSTAKQIQLNKWSPKSLACHTHLRVRRHTVPRLVLTSAAASTHQIKSHCFT